MPVIVKDYFWHQTDQIITIKLPLNGIHPSKVDIFTSEKYLKVNYNPFFFDIILRHPIKDISSTCTISENEIIFELEKQNLSHWETLHDPDVTKKDAIKIKQEIIEQKQKLLQTEHEEKQNLKGELSREAVRRQMALDSRRLEAIENYKKTERNIVTTEIEKWKKQPIKIEPTSEIQVIKPKPARSEESKQRLPVPESLPREPATINISFSERVFKTPVRESQTEDEQEWLRKQSEARKVAGWCPEDLLPEERDPEYLKQKGDKFFRQNNYIGAISAYGYGISISPKYAALYVNRSAAHFAYGNLYKCIEDCSTALELLTPPVAGNLESRAKCYARRGAALCRLGLPSKGVTELEEALKLIPGNENLKLDICKAKEAAVNEKDNDVPELFINKQLPSFYK